MGLTTSALISGLLPGKTGFGFLSSGNLICKYFLVGCIWFDDDNDDCIGTGVVVVVVVKVPNKFVSELTSLLLLLLLLS